MQRLLRTHWQALCLMIMLAVVLTAVQGCAALGVTAPKTIEDKILASVTAVNEVQKSAAVLVRAKKISPEDGENVLKVADAAVAGIAVARSYAKADPATADAKLQAVLTSLTLIQTYLATQGAK